MSVELPPHAGYPFVRRTVVERRARDRFRSLQAEVGLPGSEVLARELDVWARSASQRVWLQIPREHYGTVPRWLASFRDFVWVPVDCRAGLGQEREALVLFCQALGRDNSSLWRDGLPARLWHQIRESLWQDCEAAEPRIVCLVELPEGLDWCPAQQLVDAELGAGNRVVVVAGNDAAPPAGWHLIALPKVSSPGARRARAAKSLFDRVTALLSRTGETLGVNEIARLLAAPELTETWLEQQAPLLVQQNDPATARVGWRVSEHEAVEAELGLDQWQGVVAGARRLLVGAGAWQHVSTGWLRSFGAWLEAAQAPAAAYEELLQRPWLERWLAEPGGAHGALCDLARIRVALETHVARQLEVGGECHREVAALFVCAMVSCALVECIPEWAATWNHRAGYSLTDWLARLADRWAALLTTSDSTPQSSESSGGPVFSELTSSREVLELLDGDPPPTIPRDRWLSLLLPRLAQFDAELALGRLKAIPESDLVYPEAIHWVRLRTAHALPDPHKRALVDSLVQCLDGADPEERLLCQLLEQDAKACFDLFGLARLEDWIHAASAEVQLEAAARLLPALPPAQRFALAEVAVAAFHQVSPTHDGNQIQAVSMFPYLERGQALEILGALLFARIETNLPLWFHAHGCADLPTTLALAERIAPGTKEAVGRALRGLVAHP